MRRKPITWRRINDEWWQTLHLDVILDYGRWHLCQGCSGKTLSVHGSAEEAMARAEGW